MPLNGKTKCILWLAGILFTVMFTIVTALANNVILNDKASRNRDTLMNECMYNNRTEVIERLTRIETLVMRLEKNKGGN